MNYLVLNAYNSLTTNFKELYKKRRKEEII
ncbi:hypothetical protein CMTB2_05057 [Caminibacter mediatlanticus TB-2]|uniref:Uncharacterized protein n=1 Tax=Caminibacter mediatlanticus TB-2 TaxID=391592 RepID=A0AAI9AHB8_9BACT|nr:hypothetical protein CMTB2_05057 [Caminibacter mediatlanticus TB-2]